MQNKTKNTKDQKGQIQLKTHLIRSGSSLHKDLALAPALPVS